MDVHDTTYANTTTTTLGVDDAISLVTELLAVRGFGVLTTIDVAATLANKLGVERAPYVILGACNPTLAHAAIEQEPMLGALLPCNVVVQSIDDVTHVTAVDATAMLGLVGRPGLAAVATDVDARLREVLDELP